jgi:hypothetical protein
MLREAWYDEHRGATENALAGPLNRTPWTTVENDKPEDDEPWSKQMSLALTEDLHPGYSYRENLGDNEDLPQNNYPRPYIAT